METVTVNGKPLKGHKIDLYGAALLVIEAPKGFLACGYVNLQTAEKLGHAAAVVTGVKNFDDMLKAEVVAVSPAAESFGARAGMSGAEVLGLFA